MRTHTTGILRELGYRVLEAASGKAAQALGKLSLLPGGVDAAIVDIGLPDRSDGSLVDELRVLYPALSIVISSGGEEHVWRARHGADPRIAYLPKPFAATQLEAALRTLNVVKRK